MKSKSARSTLFSSRLAAYSATAGAALLVAPTADATIRNITTFSYDLGATFGTTPPDVTETQANHNSRLSFTGATAGYARGFNGFFTVRRISRSVPTHYVAGLVSMLPADSVVGVAGRSAKDLSFGDLIVGQNFAPISHRLASVRRSGTVTNAQYSFVPNGNSAAKTGYIGFKTVNSNGTYYGWLRVKVINDSSGLPFEVTLADKNGDGIYGAFGLAADNITAGEVAPVPEPSLAALGGLGLLALGAAGLRELRRRRQKTAN